MHPTKGEVVSSFWRSSLSMLLNRVYYILEYAWLVFGEANTSTSSGGRSITWIQFIKCWAKCCSSCCGEATIIFEFDRKLALTVAHVVLVEIVVEIVARILSIEDLVLLGDVILARVILRCLDHLFT